MTKKVWFWSLALFFIGVVTVEASNLTGLWGDYQRAAGMISARETALVRARGGGEGQVEAVKDLYRTQLMAYNAYLLWVEEALLVYGDEQGGGGEVVVSMAEAAEGVTATGAAEVLEEVTQKNLYAKDLVAAREINAVLLEKVEEVVDEKSEVEFAVAYREQTEIIEGLLYPIYTFTILSSLREANFALQEQVTLLDEALPADGGAFELNKHRLTLQQASNSLTEVSSQVVELENTWRGITDRTTYDKFLNQIRYLSSRLRQIQQLLREVNTYVNSHN
ncbi:hypothetical protein FWH30_02875 [Microgenomates group bacterium]|nr:hypothetical protein [Microgenomates group bacterium]